MKRFLFYGATFAVGFAASFMLRTGIYGVNVREYGRTEYRRGWGDGVASVHREAAFNGHGHFPDGVTFRWNGDVLQDYAPKSPGEVLEPVKSDWATRILK